MNQQERRQQIGSMITEILTPQIDLIQNVPTNTDNEGGNMPYMRRENDAWTGYKGTKTYETDKVYLEVSWLNPTIDVSVMRKEDNDIKKGLCYCSNDSFGSKRLFDYKYVAIKAPVGVTVLHTPVAKLEKQAIEDLKELTSAIRLGKAKISPDILDTGF